MGDGGGRLKVKGAYMWCGRTQKADGMPCWWQGGEGGGGFVRHARHYCRRPAAVGLAPTGAKAQAQQRRCAMRHTPCSTATRP